MRVRPALVSVLLVSAATLAIWTAAPPASAQGKSGGCNKLNQDADGDGHRAAACGGDDCDDNDPHRYPGNTEVCLPGTDLRHDEDCDPTTYGIRDADGDQFPDAQCCNAGPDGVLRCGTDCDDTNAAIVPGAQRCASGGGPNVEVCVVTSPGYQLAPGSPGFTPLLYQSAGIGGRWEVRPCKTGGAPRCYSQPNGTGQCSG
jgi:hypothetical protein